MEVYGEKPKKFTAKWWDYVWYYYKWHILGTIFAIFMFATMLTQCAARTECDLKVCLVLRDDLVLTQEENLKKAMSEIVSDATKNGKKEVDIEPVYMGDETNIQNKQALYAKLAVTVANPESYVFIMSKEYADSIIKNEIFESTKNWADGESEDEYVISLSGNETLKKMGIDGGDEELFLGVVKLFDNRQGNETEKARHENGVRFARYLIGLE